MSLTLLSSYLPREIPWTDEPSAHRDLRDFVGPASVLLLLYAGYFKGDPLLSWMPVDLTLLGAVLTLMGIIAVAQAVIPRGTCIALAVWATFVPAAILHAGNAYAELKTEHLLTLTLLSVLGPLFLVRSERRQEIWVALQIGLGCALALAAWLFPAPAPMDGAVYRLALEGSDAIASGQAAGVAVVGCLVLALTGHSRRWLLMLAGAIVTVPLFLSGSRGPVFAAALAIAAVAVAAPASAARRSVRVSLVAVSGLVAWLWLRGDTVGSVGRISSVLIGRGTQGSSAQARLMLWHYTWAYIPGHFWGTGWGGLQHVSGMNLVAGYGLVYPHNVLLEIAGEAGWIAAAAVMVFLWFGLRHLRTAAITPYPAALFGIAVFFTVNAMVSGDVNDNRVMWAAVAIGWAVTVKSG